MKQILKNETIELSNDEVEMIGGNGFFFDLGAFFGNVANANDSIYRTYGRTSYNHYW